MDKSSTIFILGLIAGIAIYLIWQSLPASAAVTGLTSLIASFIK